MILVTMDTTRKDHLGCYGYRLPTSPNLDAFAEESLVFENCYSAANFTLPSHASIFTGLYPYNHGVILHPQPLYPEVPSLAHILAAHGYTTLGVTSIGFMHKEILGKGFGQIYSPIESARYVPEMEQLQRRAGETTDVAIDVLDSLRAAGEGLFLWLHYWDPHYPYAAPDEHRRIGVSQGTSKERLEFITERFGVWGYTGDLSPDNLNEVASKIRLTGSDRKTMISEYDQEIAYMDRHIGRFLEALKRRGLYDNSIIIFTADHGDSLFENDSDWLEHNFIYEPVVRVPLIIRSPDIQPRRLKPLVQSVDIAPTVLNWLNLDAPEMDGKDMMPLISRGDPVREKVFLTEVGARVVGIVSGGYKMRMLTARRREPLPIPPSWKDEIRKLPTIKFKQPPPALWDYEQTKGVILYSWEYPSGCDDEIDKFAIELLSERVAGPYHLGVIKEVEAKTTKTPVFEYFVARRAWDMASAFCPFLLRIVARNRNGENVATSEIAPFVFKDSLKIETELYDLNTDPNERHNIAEKEPEVVHSLESSISDFAQRSLRAIENGPEVLGGRISARPEMSEEDRRRFRALGYAH